MEQRSPEWFAARKGKITGSRVGGILGVNPYKSRDEVMREMVREWFDAPREFTGNDATDWGEKMEPVAFKFYRENLLPKGVEDVTETGFHPHPRHDFIGASPDGLFVMVDGVNWRGGLEIKCPYPPYHRKNGFTPYSIKSKPSYAAQMQLVMQCCNLDEMDFLCFFDEDNYGHEVLERDERWWEDALPKLEVFHAEFLAVIANKKKAAVYLRDGDPTLDDPRLVELASIHFRLQANAERIKPLVDRFTELKRELSAEHGVGTDGVIRFATQTKRGSVDWKALADAIDIPAILAERGLSLDGFRKPDTQSVIVEAAK